MFLGISRYLKDKGVLLIPGIGETAEKSIYSD
jgi:hypothetical protein